MSAQEIYDRMPLGSFVRYSDGTLRPPERFKKKLAAWENNNNRGQTFSVNSPLTFTVIERPKPGQVRVLNRAGADAELLHLADTRAAAEAWLASHRYSDAVLDEVVAIEITSDTAEGRAA